MRRLAHNRGRYRPAGLARYWFSAQLEWVQRILKDVE
jgi:hypothetical protein